MNLWTKCLGILYPQTCYFCGKTCKKEICRKCAGEVEFIQEPRCKKCGKPIRYEEQEFCHDCEEQKIFYEEGRSIWLHKGPVRWSIYHFKYKNKRVFGEYYATEWKRLYGHKLQEWEIDVIIPVPLHATRRRKRGYNQAEVLAQELGKRCKIPVNSHAVARVAKTRAQKTLNHKERRKNLQGAFRVTRYWEREKNVLLIDDIYTTGSTINSLAKELIEQGAHKVYFLTISIGQGF